MEHAIDSDGFLLVDTVMSAPQNFTGKVKNRHGVKYWLKDGMLHREDGPAIVWADGSKWWYKNGQVHREDGPAVEKLKFKAWHKNGLLHREDGPAIEYDDGSVGWWYNGKEGLDNFPIEAKKNLAMIFLHGT